MINKALELSPNRLEQIRLVAGWAREHHYFQASIMYAYVLALVALKYPYKGEKDKLDIFPELFYCS
jgi:hypothetical protein